MDNAHENLKYIIESIKSVEMKTEEDSKIKLINEILFEVLGWDKNHDLDFELNVDGLFADYAVKIEGIYKVAIEAKKNGALDIKVSNDKKASKYKLNGPALKAVAKEIEQSFTYASRMSSPISVLTDGGVWIVYKTFHEGRPYKDREAIVFPALEAIVNDFPEFYNLISKEAVYSKSYARIFDQMYNNRVYLSRNLYSPYVGDDIKISLKSEIAYDIDTVFKNFFQKLTSDDNEEMLIECFVDTKESRYADYAIEKITSQALGRVENQNKDLGESLTDTVRAAINSESGETIFIVGPTGSGKSTFVKRFFSQTLQVPVRSKCIVSKINFLDYSGDAEVLQSWITEHLISEIHDSVYEAGIPNWDQLKGLYYKEYRQRKVGVDRHIYERDYETFRDRFSDYLDSQVNKNRESYLQRLILDLIHNRKFLPVFVVDNTDEFPAPTRLAVFQYFEAIKRSCGHVLLVFPITDKAAISYNKTDASSLYSSKSFFLPTPPPREVFRKRITFVQKKVSDAASEKGVGKKYFSSRGITFSLPNLNNFLNVIEKLFVDDDKFSKLIGDLSNYNIRNTLELANKVITSPEIDVDTLIQSYILKDFQIPNIGQMIRALVRGKYNLYKREDEHSLYPLFDESNEVLHSPLLALRVLAFLESAQIGAKSLEDRYVNFESIVSYFEAIGAEEKAVEVVCGSLVESNLIELFDPSMKFPSHGQKITLSFRGKAHLDLSISNRSFITEMALCTLISEESVAKDIRKIYDSSAIFKSKVIKVRAAFVEYLFRRDAEFVQQAVSDVHYVNQTQLLLRLKRMAGVDGVSIPTDIIVSDKETYTAKVEFYDKSKGFGFVLLEKLGVSAYLGSSIVSTTANGHVGDGDEVKVKIEHTGKGFAVTKIVTDFQDVITDVEASVVRYFPNRGYAFLSSDSYDDIFLHYSILSDSEEKLIVEGLAMNVDIGIERDNKKRVIRVSDIHV